jgi:pSer/pThr/pTyr-binding forkhead associated (FHA) protein
MTCCICTRAEARVGVLCDECRDALVGPVPITREQIRSAKGPLADAALIDVWGGVYRLCPDTTVGRALDPMLFSLYDSSISRTQARIALGDTGWTIQDLASANGTYVGDEHATAALPLVNGSRIRMGFLNFYFIEDASKITLPASLDEIGQTARPGPAVTLDVVERPKEVSFKLSEPSGGGAGVVEIGGIPVHLTLAQYELVSRLVARMVAAAADKSEQRGFISSDELAGVLSLDSLRPDDDNVRQLVRRVRRAMLKAGVGDVIESKYGLGYRLSVTPRLV